MGSDSVLFARRRNGDCAPSVELRARGEIGTASNSRLTEGAIRVVDIIGAASLLILMAPMLLLVAAVVRLDSTGPALFRQRRLGRRLRPFSVVKFRTMHSGVGAEKHREHVHQLIVADEARTRPMAKLEEDERVTRVGSVLRRTSIDELPQLWNVLRGEMSLVGPRPPIQYEVDEYPPEAFRRFAVRPGITGLWQVRGRSLLTFEQMIALDAEYVERRSLWMNLSILVRTVPTVIHGKGAA
jgi:lipopolysaccharide/colanic/teichoic acid biosynthesis glycosyltransferase